MAKTHYLTRQGAEKLREELRALLRVERPKVVQEVAEAAAQGDRSENAEYIYGKKRLREIDRRVRYLTRRLDSAQVVDAGAGPVDGVRFGAKVRICDDRGQSRDYYIVGSDEADPAQGSISYESPLGRALLRRKVGDVVTVRRPSGEVEVEILSIDCGWMCHRR